MLRLSIATAVLLAAAVCPVRAAAPAGYPPAPAGFRWDVYPGGQWGLVQDGLGVPAAPPTVASQPAAVPAVPQPQVVTGAIPLTVPLSRGLDALAEVNAKRSARGLRPFLHDPALTAGAAACAQFRANSGLFGHTSNDFAFLPRGASAASAGCAAYPAGYGWMSCCVYDNYTYAGAAAVTGRDGKRYMQLFVR